MKIQCCVCRKVRGRSGWVDARQAAELEPVSHGYCPACLAQAYKKIRATKYREMVGLGMETV